MNVGKNKVRAPIGVLSGLVRAWHNFWFQPEDPVVISLFRILVGGMAFYSVLVWGMDLPGFMGADGWQSESLVKQLQQNQTAISFWWFVPQSGLHAAHAICVLITLMFFLGLATRVTSVLSFLIVISYANRAPMANFGLDQILAFSSFYLMLGPCGARFSVDALIRNWIRERRGLQVKQVESSAFARLPLRLVQCQLCVIYFFAGISKLQGESWWSGSAVWRAAANYEYQQVSLTWLAYVPWLYQAATLGTWIWEISFSFLVWRPKLRWIVLLGGIGMHVGIGMFMGMWTFGLIMVFTYIVFLPPSFIHSTFNRIRNVAHIPSKLPSVALAPNQTANSKIDSELATPTCDKQLILLLNLGNPSQPSLDQNMKRLGYRCVHVESWRDAVRIHQMMHPFLMIFNTRTMLPEDVIRMLTKVAADNSATRFIGLVEPHDGPRIPDMIPDHQVLWTEFPLEPNEFIDVLKQLHGLRPMPPEVKSSNPRLNSMATNPCTHKAGDGAVSNTDNRFFTDNIATEEKKIATNA